jgi:heparosan-N-sulfate-glucuronate 5-epimerase
MSLLARAYRLTGRGTFLRAAERALLPLEARPGRTPLVTCFDGCKHPFFEEYPSVPRSDVLNGFMFTLVGLYNLASVAPHSGALALYRAGRRTLDLALPRYDKRGVARYSLASGNVAAQHYQAIHVYLLRALDSLHQDPRLVFYANRWLAHLGRAPA